MKQWKHENSDSGLQTDHIVKINKSQLLKVNTASAITLPWKEYVVKHGRIIGLMVIVISASPSRRGKVIRTSSLDTEYYEYYERHCRTSLNGIVILR